MLRIVRGCAILRGRPPSVEEETMRHSRRQALGLGLGAFAAAALPISAHAALEDAIAAFTGGAATAAGDISIDAPEIAENGNAVPVSVSAPGAVAIMILGAGNPEPVIARVAFGPAAGGQTFATRVRLARTQDVVALAKLADGSVIEARAAVKVTIGGCGG
jgi:sulfur-oxidizing protein SoxY